MQDKFEIEEKKQKAEKYIDQAENFIKDGKYMAGLKAYQKVANLYFQLGSYMKISDIFMRITTILENDSMIYESIEYLNKIRKRFNNLDLPEEEGKIVMLMGNLAFKLGDFETAAETSLNSKIESKFYNTWKMMHGWKAIPEPEAIIVGNRVIIPDFLLKRGKTEVYVEIVGYYTHQYIQKKKNVMTLLARNNVPIIYLIDEQLRPHFIDLRNIHAVYYSKNEVPTKELLTLLEENYTDYEERVPVLLGKLDKICNKLTQNGALTLQQLETQIETYSRNELLRILQTPEAQQIFTEHGITFIKSFGLVHNQVIEDIRQFLTKHRKIEYAVLKQQFPEYGEAIVPICQYLGAQLRWKSFQDILIIAPRNLKQEKDENNTAV